MSAGVGVGVLMKRRSHCQPDVQLLVQLTLSSSCRRVVCAPELLRLELRMEKKKRLLHVLQRKSGAARRLSARRSRFTGITHLQGGYTLARRRQRKNNLSP